MYTQKELYEALLKVLQEITETEIPKAVRKQLKQIAEDNAGTAKAPLELIPYSLLKDVLGESFDSTLHNFLPVSLSNSGVLTNPELTHEFNSKNACPYFQPTELCGLDGRICLYDTETYPVCPRYREGFNRKTPGFNGKPPVEPPRSALDKPKDQEDSPFAKPISQA
jgi:hypothetical protein